MGFVSYAKVAAKTTECLWVLGMKLPDHRKRKSQDAEVLWLREAKATVSLVHNGCLVDERGLFTDSTPLSCIDQAEEAALALAHSLDINSDSTLQVCVSILITDRPVIQAQSEKMLGMNVGAIDGLEPRCFEEIPHDCQYGKSEMARHAPGDVTPSLLMTKSVFEGVILRIGGRQGGFALRKEALRQRYFDFQDQADQSWQCTGESVNAQG